MPQHIPVCIRLHSRHEGDDVVQELPAEATIRGSSLYIRYEDPQDGKTRTTVKIGQDELKLIRHGHIQSEQTFRQGSRLPGFYRSRYMNFMMSADTGKLDIRLDGLSGYVEWAYDLYVYEQFSGHFAISLWIQEGQK